MAAVLKSEPDIRSQPARTPLNVVPMTPPVEATLRILLNSVPYLIGAAVVRQPLAGDTVAAEVGRMPWLHDRRLLTLQLPDDTLPANRAVFLDWPVPYQAEWVGAPPRLLISRLVARDRTVGVLLGTLITRDQVTPQAREALDLSCELIAAAVGSDSLGVDAAPLAEQQRGDVPEPQAMEVAAQNTPQVAEPLDEQGERDREFVDEVAGSLDALTDARSIGRVLRNAVSVVVEIDGFSLSLFNSARREVAYRYKVVGNEPESAEMGRQPVDDSPDCYAARHDRRWHAFVREIGVRGEPQKISVVQYPLKSADEVFGVATLEIFGDEGFSDHATLLSARILEVSSDRLAAVRRTARFKPSLSPPEPAAAVVLPPVAAAPSPTKSGAAAPSPTVSAAAAPSTTDKILNDLLEACAELGLPRAFMVGVDPAAGQLRGELISASREARELDEALGISAGRFTVELADRYNAIARACREDRIVTASSLDEIVRDPGDAASVAALKQLGLGGRSMIVPMSVAGQVVGALVIGPMTDDPAPDKIDTIRARVSETATRLAAAWHTTP